MAGEFDSGFGAGHADMPGLGNGFADGRRRLLQGAVGAGLLGALSGVSAAAPKWPQRPVHWVIPFPAAGATDIGARAISAQFLAATGQPLIVDNRPGGDGVVGAQEALRGAPDGQTLFFATATAMSYLPNLRRNPPYDPEKDFSPISLLCTYTFLLMVSPSLGVNNVAELVAHVKANPGKINYASGNSTSILAMAQLVRANNLDMVHVPYKGEAPALVDLVGGRVQMIFTTPAITQQLMNAGFRPLAALLPRRASGFPDVPTMAEAGQPLVNLQPWGGLFAPAGLSADLTGRIGSVFNELLQRREVVEQLDKVGMTPTLGDAQAAARMVTEQRKAWGETMRAAGIEPS